MKRWFCMSRGGRLPGDAWQLGSGEAESVWVRICSGVRLRATSSGVKLVRELTIRSGSLWADLESAVHSLREVSELRVPQHLASEWRSVAHHPRPESTADATALLRRALALLNEHGG